jgi:hypothetical protein
MPKYKFIHDDDLEPAGLTLLEGASQQRGRRWRT